MPLRLSNYEGKYADEALSIDIHVDILATRPPRNGRTFADVLRLWDPSGRGRDTASTGWSQ